MTSNIYSPDAFPSSSLPPVDPDASLNNPFTDVNAIANVQDPPGSVYAQNQVGFSKTLILNRSLNSIITLTNTLQLAAAAQANQLNFLTQWQKVYTDTIGQIHSFSANNGDTIDGSGDNSTNARSDLNAENANYTTLETNRSSVVSDSAKTAQTAVSQTADSVNAQSSLATSFLQTLNTLLSSIYASSSAG